MKKLILLFTFTFLFFTFASGQSWKRIHSKQNFLDSVNFSKNFTITNNFLNLTPQSSAPSPATEGMMYVNTNHHLYYYNGSEWKQIDNSSIPVSSNYIYINPAGNDVTGNGTISYPFASLHHACSVSASGDTIYITNGNYTENTQCIVPPAVTITGAGKWTARINSTVTASNTPTILLNSASEGTNGNQSLFNFTLSGGTVLAPTAWQPIEVTARSNVIIRDCNIVNFFHQGVTFKGTTTDIDSPPGTYATGNRVYNTSIKNCSDYFGSGTGGDGQGCLRYGGQSGFQVYNDTIIQKGRGVNSDGYCIKFTSYGFNHGDKIHDNYIEKERYDGATFDIAVELWNCRGGIEFYNNTLIGGLDFGGNHSLTNDIFSHGFAGRVYNNIIGEPSLGTEEEVGIHVERGHTGGMYIYCNTFKNLTTVIEMYQGAGDLFEDFYVYDNIFNNLGRSGVPYFGNGCDWGTIDFPTITYDNINFVNNTIYAGAGGQPNSGLRFTFKGTATNVTIDNNIMQGFAAYPIYIENCTIDIISIENNQYFSNGTDAVGISGSTLTNYTNANNAIGNPLFVTPGTNFHLQAGSPCINTGKTIGWVSYDRDFVAVNTPREKGCYIY